MARCINNTKYIINKRINDKFVPVFSCNEEIRERRLEVELYIN